MKTLALQLEREEPADAWLLSIEDRRRATDRFEALACRGTPQEAATLAEVALQVSRLNWQQLADAPPGMGFGAVAMVDEALDIHALEIPIDLEHQEPGQSPQAGRTPWFNRPQAAESPPEPPAPARLAPCDLAAIHQQERKMGFTIFTPTTGRAVQAGQCSVNANGALSLNATDLANVGITTEAIVLVDAAQRRLAFRALIEGEKAPTVKVRWAKSRCTAMLGVASAIAAAGGAKFKGRLDVQVQSDSGRGKLLVVELKGSAKQ